MSTPSLLLSHSLYQILALSLTMPCPECFCGSVHTFAKPTGTMETIHGISTYVAGGSDPSRSKSAIIYLTDAFALRLVNNKLLADKYAASTGCRVLIPEVVHNGGLDPSLMPQMEIAMGSLERWTVNSLLHKAYTTACLLPKVASFLLLGHPAYAYPKILQYARAVKRDLPAGGKLGVAGFCWGGWSSTKLCTEASVEGGTERLIDAQFNGHPSYMNSTQNMFLEAIWTFNVPYSSAVAGADFEFSGAVAAKTEAMLRDELGRGYKYEFRVYDECTHGFCIRAKEDTVNMEGYEAAANQATTWFNQHLNPELPV